MTTRLPHPRYERKFIASGLTLAEVLAMVRRHPALFREVYPPRAVNNLYLDSPSLRDYFDHVNGAAHRAKTRIRWYGPLDGRVEKPTLERKLKRGAVSGKLTHAMPAFSINGGVARAALDASLDRAEVPDPMRASLRLLQPSLVNRYQRRYFLSADGRFRLTVDSGLEFFRVRDVGTSMKPAACCRSMVILELKFDPRHADRAAEVTNRFEFRLARCSKYVLGIESFAAR